MNKIHRMTTRRKVLKTDKDVIAAYGGANKAARRWLTDPTIVSRWLVGGIPAGLHLRMVYDLEKLGYIVDVVRLGWV